MEAAVEKRTVNGSRIPLDVLVELMHEDYEEAFEADALNLGMGGLSMRAPYLPDVGSRMTCRFECPPTGERIEADAEVVWAQDTGAHTGEFGLRFVELAEDAHDAIRRLVRGSESYLPPPPSSEDTIDEQPSTQIELALDGVASPIVARVIHADAEGMAVEQDLPFLRLRTGITMPDGRRGRIEAVDLSVEGETPKILLDVSYDERSFVVPEADATIPDFFPTGVEAAQAPDTVSEAAGAIVEPPARVADPAPHVVDARPAREAARAPASAPAPTPAEPVMTESHDERPAREPSRVFATTPREEHERELENQRATEAARSAEGIVAAERAAMRRGRAVARAKVAFASTGARLAPATRVARAKLALAWARLGPWCVALIARARQVAKLAGDRIGPTARTSLRFVKRTSGRAAYVLRERLGRRFPRLAPADARRRTTAPAPREPNVARARRRQHAELAEPDRRGRGRTVAAAVVVVAAVALGVYAFLPADEPVEEGRIEMPVDVAPAAAPPAPRGAVDPEQGEGLPAPAPNAPAAQPQVPTSVEPAVPTAMGDPSRQAGPIPPPTFPSLREGARPQSPQTVPEGSPYAVDVREGGETVQTQTTTSPSTFGADAVSNGRSFVIRMSRPVDRIEGTALTDGFRVRIPGSLSLDRAGPIASAHPFVDRSMILNRGDHAEMTIRFVEGRSPAYRVTARGSAIEVVIAQ